MPTGRKETHRRWCRVHAIAECRAVALGWDRFDVGPTSAYAAQLDVLFGWLEQRFDSRRRGALGDLMGLVELEQWAEIEQTLENL